MKIKKKIKKINIENKHENEAIKKEIKFKK
jgi:hypothetical protein